MFSFLLLLATFLIEGIYGLVANSAGTYCVSESVSADRCINNAISDTSIANRMNDSKSYYIMSWLNFFTIMIIFVFLQFFRRHQRLTDREIDRGLISPSDYTIMITKLPIGEYDENTLRGFVDGLWEKMAPNSKKQKIENIHLAYNISDYVSVLKRKETLRVKRTKAEGYFQIEGKYPDEIELSILDDEIARLQAEKTKLEKEIEKGVMKNSCGVAFITFACQEEHRTFLQYFEFNSSKHLRIILKRNLCCKSDDNRDYSMYNNHVLYIERAPEPNDIIWENLGFSDSFKLKRRAITSALTFILLVVCFLIIFFISIGQQVFQVHFKENKAGDVRFGVRALGVLASFLIFIVNSILKVCIKKFSQAEKQKTITHLHISLAIKLTIAQFCNTAIISLLANLIVLRRDHLFVEGGLVYDIFSVFILNAILPPLFNFFDPEYILKKIKQKKIESEGMNSFQTQSEANDIFEGTHLIISNEYAYILNTLWFSMFYAIIMPLGLLISMCGLVLYYLIVKFLLVKRYARPQLLSIDLNSRMVELLELCPLMMALGAFIFNYILYDPTPFDLVPNILSLILSSIHLFFPSTEINEKFCHLPEDVVIDVPYEEAKLNFAIDYERANPITQEKAMNNWIQNFKKFNKNENQMNALMKSMTHLKKPETADSECPNDILKSICHYAYNKKNQTLF